MALVLLIYLKGVSRFTSNKKRSAQRRLIMQTIEATLPETKISHCPLCDETLANPNECSKCDWVTGYGETIPEAGLIKPRDLVASLLGLMVPGLGHVYKGQTKAGIVFLAGAALVSF